MVSEVVESLHENTHVVCRSKLPWDIAAERDVDYSLKVYWLVD